MRILTGLAAAACVVALAGCSAFPPKPASQSRSSAPAGGYRAPGPSAALGQTTAPDTRTSPLPTSASSGTSSAPFGPKTSTGAREIAAQFDGLLFSSQFEASWGLLTNSAKLLISENLWVKVHESCAPASSGAARKIASVTIFGDTAIISETITGASSGHDTDNYLLSYANDRWAYSPDDMNIYHHGSVADDVAAAKAAGFCGSPKVF